MTLLLAAYLMAADAGPLPVGNSHRKVVVDGETLELFAFKPKNYDRGPILFVFHGVLRNAEEYRDHAHEMGERFGALVVAPRFSEHDYPLDRFQLGGIIADGKIQPRKNWTGRLIPEMAAAVRRIEGRDDLPYYLIGHSGGGQFLIRLAAFVPHGAQRIVVANAGTLVFPTREQFFPFGFGGLPDEIADDAAVRRYLAQPLTIYLGTEDLERDEYFLKTASAERQGNTRYARGKNLFEAAEKLARERHWDFAWKLVEAEGIGHDHSAMFNHRQCAEALGLTPRR